ncbi:YjcZ family sporulation protein [Oceanobacillus saliphilus]|nr:YjcZ family sporulation protein [Oceanobacillus saliphilus]
MSKARAVSPVVSPFKTSGFALLVVLFILLVIIGTAYTDGYGKGYY